MIFLYFYWVDKVARRWKMEALVCRFGCGVLAQGYLLAPRSDEKQVFGIFLRILAFFLLFCAVAGKLRLGCNVEPAVNRQPSFRRTNS